MENKQCLPVGTVLPGSSYQIEAVLGQGNFGITYRVYDTALERIYALKEFFPQDLSDRDYSVSLLLETSSRRKEQFEALKQKFISEARTLSKCNHPGIVKITSIFFSMDTAYYLMDFVDGVTLREKYARQPLKPGDAIAMIKKIAEPLSYIHEHKIVHFDLNPNNVMVRPDGSVVLIDFGFAKRYDESGKQMSSLLVAGGTAGYIAPEQLGGVIRDFTPRPDIYALGGILYFLLTGHAPVSCQEILQDSSVLLNELPKEFHDFFQKAMAIKMADRFASVDEFVDNLSGIIKEKLRNKDLYMPIQKKNGKWNFIDSNGKYLSKQWFEEVSPFKEGWACVRRYDRWNYINEEGKYMNEYWFYDGITPFSEGWAAVRTGCTWYFINSEGEFLRRGEIFRGEFYGAGLFSEGWACVKVYGLKFNFINSAGKYLSDQRFDLARTFSEGWACVKLSGKWNYVNSEGIYLSDQCFDFARTFSEGWGCVELNGRWNFINSEGEYRFDRWFERAFSFEEGWARVKLDGKWNYINSVGKYLLAKWSEDASSFEEGWALVKLNGKYNFINSAGKYLSDQWFEYVDYSFRGREDRLFRESKSFYGNRVIGGWALVKLNGKYNFINSAGKYLSDQWFENAKSFAYRWTKVKLKGWRGYVYDSISTSGRLRSKIEVFFDWLMSL